MGLNEVTASHVIYTVVLLYYFNGDYVPYHNIYKAKTILDEIIREESVIIIINCLGFLQ